MFAADARNGNTSWNAGLAELVWKLMYLHSESLCKNPTAAKWFLLEGTAHFSFSRHQNVEVAFPRKMMQKVGHRCPGPERCTVGALT